jgi:hypothetical protein
MRDIDRKIWPLSLEQIEATVSAHLGPGRVRGNKEEPCFSRQISMYLANRIGGWSTPRIGRFYDGRHHTTVLHAIRKVERRRQVDESTDALIEILIAELGPEMAEPPLEDPGLRWRADMIGHVSARVLEYLAEQRTTEPEPDNESKVQRQKS